MYLQVATQLLGKCSLPNMRGTEVRSGEMASGFVARLASEWSTAWGSREPSLKISDLIAILYIFQKYFDCG